MILSVTPKNGQKINLMIIIIIIRRRRRQRKKIGIKNDGTIDWLA